ncbi:hypothetical protein ACTHPW_18530 [Bacillus velezensis]|uniref:hypothetical protein n=1 Tax=Bacillus velezensis TaxID=492670 RepID=UPI003F7C21F6
MAFKNKVTIEEITRYTKEQAERNALTMNNPLVVPVYVAIDTNEEGVSRIASQNLNSLFGKQVEMSNRKYTETEYLVFKSFQLGMSDGQVPDVLAKYESFKEWFNEEGISEEALYQMKERFEKETVGTLPNYKGRKYLDDLRGSR